MDECALRSAAKNAHTRDDAMLVCLATTTILYYYMCDALCHIITAAFGRYSRRRVWLIGRNALQELYFKGIERARQQTTRIIFKARHVVVY